MDLDREEQLTTVMVAVVDTAADEVWGICAGDGLIYVEGRAMEFDSGNVPNYMAYHWKHTFAEWLAQHTRQFHFERVREFALSTDCILAFEQLDKGHPPVEVDLNVVDFILAEHAGGAKALGNQVRLLEERWGLIATDDLGMVQLRW